MTTYTQFFAARLVAGLFALPRTMTLLLTSVCTTLQSSTTYVTATDLLEPAWLVLERVLAAHARLGRKERALGAALIVLVTVMSDLRMSASLGPPAVEAAGWWFGTAWQRRLQYSTATMATELVEDGFATGTAGALMTQLLTTMGRVTTLQLATTWTRADMLRFEVLLRIARCRIERPAFSTTGLAFGGLALACAATFATFVSSTVERDSANSHALRWLDNALMTDRR